MKKILVFFLIVMSMSLVANNYDSEIIVKVRDKSFENSIDKNFSYLKTLSSFQLSFGAFIVVKSVGEKSLKETIQILEKESSVIYAEPNFRYHKLIASTIRDHKFKVQWGLQNTGRNEPYLSRVGVKGADISAILAWEIAKGSREIKVAVIDSGIDYTHPDLRDNIWVNTREKNGISGVDDDGNGFIDDIHGYDFVNNDGDPMDDDDTSHGTHCAGTIGAAHNGQGIVGVNARVSLVAIKFLGSDGVGSTENSIRAIDYAIKNQVDVMSISWGGKDYSKAQEDAIKSAAEAGIAFVTASGNQSVNLETTKFYPVCYDSPNILAVGAHTAQDKLAPFSNYSKSIVDLVAPGMSIMSTINNGYQSMSGTSMAAPHVAGAIALLFSYDGVIPLKDLFERIRATSTPISNYRKFTKNSGRLNLYNLLINKRPLRDDPHEGEWIDYKLSEPFETAHPYRNNDYKSATYKIKGAKYIRAFVSRYETERSFDYLSILNGREKEIDRISRTGLNYTTDFVKGDTLILRFVSDMMTAKWGVRVTKLQYVKP